MQLLIIATERLNYITLRHIALYYIYICGTCNFVISFEILQLFINFKRTVPFL